MREEINNKKKNIIYFYLYKSFLWIRIVFIFVFVFFFLMLSFSHRLKTKSIIPMFLFLLFSSAQFLFLLFFLLPETPLLSRRVACTGNSSTDTSAFRGGWCRLRVETVWGDSYVVLFPFSLLNLKGDFDFL